MKESKEARSMDKLNESSPSSSVEFKDRKKFPSMFSIKRSNDLKELTTDIRDYEIFDEIGGVEDISYLFAAKHIPSGLPVSLKLTDLTLSTDYEFITELITTCRNNSLIRHDNIVPQMKVFIDGENLWTATIPFRATMRMLLKNYFTDGMPEPIVATVLKETINGLCYLHENFMIHNDIKADNILLDSHGHVKIGGFRQLRALQQGGTVKKTICSLVGDNIEWAAPEIISQNSRYSKSADIYSLGITAMELAFNKTPFDGWAPIKNFECPAVVTQHVLSKHYYRFIQQCVQKDPELRPKIQECLEFHLIRNAKSVSSLESALLKKINKGEASFSDVASQ